jgi:hypothetical protein
MTSNNTPLDLDAIEARAQAAEDGWTVLIDEADPHRFEIHGDGPTHVAVFGGNPDDAFASYPVRENAVFAAHARGDVPALLAEVRRLADLVREACMLRDFHRRQADHLAAKRDLAETVLAKWQAGDLKPEQALWMLQDAHAVGDVKTFDQLLTARPSA